MHKVDEECIEGFMVCSMSFEIFGGFCLHT